MMSRTMGVVRQELDEGMLAIPDGTFIPRTADTGSAVYPRMIFGLQER